MNPGLETFILGPVSHNVVPGLWIEPNNVGSNPG